MEDQQVRSNTFSEDGRLLQAEYAIKNVSKAGTIAGVACADGVVLVGVNILPSVTLEKIYCIDAHTYCAVAGVFSDALRLVKYARLRSATIGEELGVPPRLSVVCEAVARTKQRFTHMGGTRPFGVSFLYAGVEDGRPALYSTDPSGTLNAWRAWAFGLDADAINTGLRNDPPAAEMRAADGVAFLLRAMGRARETPPEMADRLEVLVHGQDGARMLRTEEVRAVLEQLQGERRSSE